MRAASPSSCTATGWALCNTHASCESHKSLLTWQAGVKQHAAAICGGGCQKAPVWVPGNCRHAAAVALPDQSGGPAFVSLQQSGSHQQHTSLAVLLGHQMGMSGYCCASSDCHSGHAVLLVGRLYVGLTIGASHRGQNENPAFSAPHTTGDASACLVSCVVAVGAPCPCGRCRCASRCCRWRRHRRWSSSAGTEQLDAAW